MSTTVVIDQLNAIFNSHAMSYIIGWVVGILTPIIIVIFYNIIQQIWIKNKFGCGKNER